MPIFFTIPVKAKLSQKISQNYISLDDQLQTNLNLLLNKSDLEHDLTQGDVDLGIFFDGSTLLKGKRYPQNIKLEIYTMQNGQKSLLSLINRTIKNKKAALNVFFRVHLPRIESTTDLMFDVYDSDNVLVSTFTKEIIVNSSPAVSSLETVPDFTCASIDGECLLEYMLRHVTFSANFDNSLKTQVYKNDKGRYVVNIPIKKGRKIGKKVKGFNFKGSGGKTSSKANGIANFEDGYPYFEDGEEIALTFWNNVRDAIEFKFDSTNKTFDFKKDGSLQLSTIKDDAYLNIAPGTNSKAPIVLSQGELLTSPVEGAIEYDGNNLYFTAGSSRQILGATGPVGPPGPMGPAGPSGSAASGTDLSNGGFLSSSIEFLGNGLLQDAKFNGTISISTGANNGYVLTSDFNGNASWRSIGSVANGGVSSSGVAGAVQFSDGAGGFSSDNGNLFWDNATKYLGLGTSTANAKLTLENPNGDSDIRTYEYKTSGTGPQFAFYKARGSKASPVALGNGMETGKINFAGFGDTAFRSTAMILTRADGVITDTSSPGYMQFRTTPASGTSPIPRMTIKASGFTGVDTEGPQAQLDIGGGTRTFIDGNQDLLVADDAEIDGDLYVNGSIFAPNLDSVMHRYITVPAFGGAVGDAYEFVSLQRIHGAHNFQMTVTAAIGGHSVAKHYVVSTQYGQTSNVYQLLLPVTSTGPYGGEFDIDINVQNDTTTLRLRKKSGTIAGDYQIHIDYLGVNDATITELANASAGVARPVAEFEGNPLTQVNSNVGVNFLDPTEALSVNGSIQMKDGNQATGFVMTSDAAGVSSWQDPSTLFSGVASGALGAIQFSDGTNGFSADENNFFWDDTNNRLGIGNSSPSYTLDVNGLIQVDSGLGPILRTYSDASTFRMSLTGGSGAANLRIGSDNNSSTSIYAHNGPINLEPGPYNGRGRYQFHQNGLYVRTYNLAEADDDSPTYYILEGLDNGSPGITRSHYLLGTYYQDSQRPAMQVRTVDASNSYVGFSDNNNFIPGAKVHVDNGDMFVTDGSVGVGTSRPNQLLTVNGALSFTTTGTNYLVSLAGGNDLRLASSHFLADFGLWARGTARSMGIDGSPTVMNLFTNSTVKATITNSGNMGIGFTSPAEKLAVNGSIQMVDGNQAAGYVMTSNASGVAYWQDLESAINGIGLASSGAAGAIQFSNGANGFNSDVSNFYWDDVNHRLGIGDSSPSYNLDINGNVQIQGANYSLRFIDLGVSGHSIVSSSSGEHIRFHPSNRTYFYQEVTLNAGQSTRDFQVYGQNNQDFLEADVVNERLGIGTDFPATKLEVNGDLTVSTGNLLLVDVAGTRDGHKIGRLGVNYQSSSNPELESDGTIIYFADDMLLHGAAAAHTIGASNNTTADLDITHHRSGHGIGFSTNNGSAIETRMYLNSVGNLGVGDPAPTYNIDAYKATTGAYVRARSGVGAGSGFLAQNTVGSMWGLQSNAAGNFEIYDFTNARSILNVNNVSGNVAIGAAITPQRAVHISDTMRLEPRSAAPAAAALGDIYVDSDSNELCFYDGATWTGIKAGGACI